MTVTIFCPCCGTQLSIEKEDSVEHTYNCAKCNDIFRLRLHNNNVAELTFKTNLLTNKTYGNNNQQFRFCGR